jgi:hypothetical protein
MMKRLLLIGLALVVALTLIGYFAGRSRTPVASQAGASTKQDAGAPGAAIDWAAQAFALRFCDEWLTWGPATGDATEADDHATRIAPFLATDLLDADPQAGWTPSSTVNGQGVQVVSTAGYTVNGNYQDVECQAKVVPGGSNGNGRWVYWWIHLSGAPDSGSYAVVAPPQPAAGATVRSDAAVTLPSMGMSDAQLSAGEMTSIQQNVLQPFFQSYVNGDGHLGAFTTAGANIADLRGQALAFVSLDTPVFSLAANGRIVAGCVVHIRDLTSGALFAPQYQVTLVQQAGHWFVAALS